MIVSSVKQPPSKYARPLKVNLAFPILFLIGCVFLVVMPIIQAPVDTAIGIGIMLSGLPVYFLCVYWQGKLKCIDNFMGKLWSVLVYNFKKSIIQEENSSKNQRISELSQKNEF